MKRTLLFAIVLLALLATVPVMAQEGTLTLDDIEEIGRTGAVSVGGGIGPQREPVAQEFMTPGETLVMNWIEASLYPLSESEMRMLAPDFVFYDTFGDEPKGADEFIKLNHISFPGFFTTFLAECVVKGEHNLVEATYLLKNDGPFWMPPGLERTILFRIENGMIAEAWLDHSL